MGGVASKGEGHTSLSTAKKRWGTESYVLGRAQRPPCQPTTQGTSMAMLTPHARAHCKGELCAGLGPLGWLQGELEHWLSQAQARGVSRVTCLL